MLWSLRCGRWIPANFYRKEDPLKSYSRTMIQSRKPSSLLKLSRYLINQFYKPKKPPEISKTMALMFNNLHLNRKQFQCRAISMSASGLQEPRSSSNPAKEEIDNKDCHKDCADINKNEDQDKSNSKSDVGDSPLTANQPDKIGKHYTTYNPQRTQKVTQMSREEVTDNIRGYLFTKFTDRIKNYDKIFEAKFPSAVKMYRTFFDGIRDLVVDLKRFTLVTRIISNKGIKALNRKELELYLQIQNDMIKIAPVLLFSALPFVGYLILPLAFMFPRRLLTNHFWNEEQRVDFIQSELKDRLKYYETLLCCLNEKGRVLVNHPKFQEYNNILKQLKNGSHPTVTQILEIKDVFSDSTFNLITLSRKHIKLLVRMHDASRSLLRRHSLYEHAFVVHYMDLAIVREGGVHNMTTSDLRKACYIRGLNPNNLGDSELVQWLRDWIKISTSITSEQLTLYLHLPIFLAHNHPNNTRLLKSKISQRFKQRN